MAGRTGGRRHTIARHGMLRKPSAASFLAKTVGIAMTSVLVATLGVVAFIGIDLANTYTADAVDIGTPEAAAALPPDISEIEGGVNVLIAGTDSCEPEYAQYFGDRCANGGDEGNNSDVNIVLHISPEPRRVTVLSFPRDLMVEIPECTDADGNTTSAQSFAMLNSAFGTGGLACTVQTIANLSGLDIQYAASVNWGGVMQITDAVGGVDVCLARPMKDENTGIDWPAGMRTVQGLEALQFLRTRYGVGGSDLNRINNQQQYMSRLANKLLSEDVLSNPITMLKLAKVGLGAVDPSTSLTNPTTIVQIALAIKDVKTSDISFLSYPVLTDPWDENRVVPDEASAENMMATIKANQPYAITGSAGRGVVKEGATAEETAQAADAQANGESVDESAGGDGTGEATGDASATQPAPDAATPSDVVALPENVKGTTAAEQTCSAGNG